MLFPTEKPFVPLNVTENDMITGTLAFAWSLGFGYFTVVKAIKETKRARRINTYVVLIWGELTVCLAFAIICWLYLRGTIPPSFEFFFSILTCWALQVQLLLQIIVNRLCILLPTETRRNQLRFGVAGMITAINISVYCIWVPAKLQINQNYHDINVWWDRCEKCLYLVVDAGLNWYFIRTVKNRLIKHGFRKYDPLVQFNQRIILVSLGMDVLIIGMMSLPNDFVYMQFHPVAYIVKLHIEMAMSTLIIKVAQSTGINVDEDDSTSPSSNLNRTGLKTEVHVATEVFTTNSNSGPDAFELSPNKQGNWAATKHNGDALSITSDAERKMEL